jgi:hypothetical protein
LAALDAERADLQALLAGLDRLCGPPAAADRPRPPSRVVVDAGGPIPALTTRPVTSDDSLPSWVKLDAIRAALKEGPAPVC